MTPIKSHGLILDVAVLDAGADTLSTFHYLAPERDETPPIGSMVIAPFGNSTRLGIVVGYPEKSDVEEIKPIYQRIRDFEPLNPELVDLAAWISAYYIAAPGSVFTAMIPIGARFGVRRWALPEDKSTAPQPRGFMGQVLAKIREYPAGVPVAGLKKILGRDPARDLGSLQKMGLVTIEYRLSPPKVSIKKFRVLCLDVDKEQALVEAEKREKRAPKQAAALRFLASCPAPVTGSELAARCGAGMSAPLKKLLDDGLARVEIREAGRIPCRAPFDNYSSPKLLTPEQKAVFDEADRSLRLRENKVILVEGITGSGKTEIYLQAVARCLGMGRRAIVLVPEIALTTVMTDIFAARFGNRIAILHSGLSDGERYDEYRRINSDQVDIVLGARSAIFSPLKNIGLIVIDEEQEGSFKQENSPRYHAVTVAIRRARAHNAVALLGTATPTVESYSRGRDGTYTLLRLSKRIDDRPLPKVEVVDMREVPGSKNILSPVLVEALGTRLEAGEQALLFHNRRGYNNFVICRACGLVVECPNCSVSMKFHIRSRALQCHFCDFRTPMPEKCPRCGSGFIGRFGYGTEKVEEEIGTLFPGVRIARMDRDTTTTKGSHRRIISQFSSGAVDILIGTQMVAKGFDFPGITLVGVLSADTGLHLPDFRAGERTFGILTQVAGRAGRGNKPGRVIVQSFTPEHYAIRFAVEQNFPAFWEHEIKVRERAVYPPFARLIRVIVSHQELIRVQEAAMKLAGELRSALKPGGRDAMHQLLGPSEAAIPRLQNRHRWTMVLKTRSQTAALRALHRALENLPSTLSQCIAIDVDPISML